MTVVNNTVLFTLKVAKRDRKCPHSHRHTHTHTPLVTMGGGRCDYGNHFTVGMCIQSSCCMPWIHIICLCHYSSVKLRKTIMSLESGLLQFQVFWCLSAFPHWSHSHASSGRMIGRSPPPRWPFHAPVQRGRKHCSVAMPEFWGPVCREGFRLQCLSLNKIQHLVHVLCRFDLLSLCHVLYHGSPISATQPGDREQRTAWVTWCRSQCPWHSPSWGVGLTQRHLQLASCTVPRCAEWVCDLGNKSCQQYIY